MQLSPPMTAWFRERPPSTPDGGVGADVEPADGADLDGRWWACAACRARIAPRSALFAVSGRTDHVRHNPHGLVFHIRCLRTAPGARAAGVGTTAHTWFAGYAWRVALCAGCRVHLGWGFEGPGEPPRFWGLIGARLVEIEGG